jgi:hypothetical protein
MEFTWKSFQIITFQPEGFYDLTIEYLQNKNDTSIWLRALSSDFEKKNEAINR